MLNIVKSSAFDELERELKKAEISLTPLIDMVFILLIFFVVTTTFTKETGITVKKAKAATSEIINNNIFAVAIDTTGTYWHDSKKVAVDDVVAQIEKQLNQDGELSIVIIPDKNGLVEPLITIMDKLRARSITKFSIGTQRVIKR
jgi:biopolymer transport protein ExbD